MRLWPSRSKWIIWIAGATILCVAVLLAFKYHAISHAGGPAAAAAFLPFGFGNRKKAGFIAHDTPDEMRVRRTERVAVGITRSSSLNGALIADLSKRREPVIESTMTSKTMGVDLKGDAFKITQFSEHEQVIDGTAYWEFDVQPIKTGMQSLMLCSHHRLDSGIQSRPLKELKIRVRINIFNNWGQFIDNNLALIALVVSLTGVIATGIGILLAHSIP